MKPFLPLLFLPVVASLAQPAPRAGIDLLGGQYVARPQNHGLVIGWVHNGTSGLQYYGAAEKGSGASLQANSLFELGELSSVFTTTLLARMSHDGEVSVDDPVQSLMPAGQRLPLVQQLDCEPTGWPEPGRTGLYVCKPKSDDVAVSLRLCDLATHTSGLPPNPTNLKKWLNAQNPYAEYSQEDLYRFLNNYPMRFSAGPLYQYSNTGMALLGYALSQKKALTFEELLQQKLTVPLGLAETRTRLNDEQRRRLLPGHNRQGQQVANWDTDIMAPALGVYTTGPDLLKFLAVNLGTEAESWYYACRFAHDGRMRVPDKQLKNTKTGLGWLITPLEKTDEELVWMKGQTGGFNAYIGFIPGRNIGVVALSNSAGEVETLSKQALQILLESTGKSAAAQAR